MLNRRPGSEVLNRIEREMPEPKPYFHLNSQTDMMSPVALELELRALIVRTLWDQRRLIPRSAQGGPLTGTTRKQRSYFSSR
jgi:hypothetical protein